VFCWKGGCSNYWYIKGAAERILKEIVNILAQEWRSWVDWPIYEVLNR
jgi:hypothetical protein